MKQLNRIQGVSLLEALITILIIAIGMLGIAALQIKTMNTTQESYSRSQGVAILEDAASRIRANREYFATDPSSTTVTDDDGIEAELANPYTNNLDGEFFKWCQRSETTPYVANNLCAGSCSARELALADIDQACLTLDNSGMSNASLGVLCNDRDGVDEDTCSAGSKLTLYVAWEQGFREGDRENINTRCQNVLTGVGDGFSCVILELVP